MDNQNQNSSQSRLPENMRVKKKVWIIVAAVGVLILLIGGWFVWQNYFSPDAQRQKQLQERIDSYNSYINTYEAAMKADTYGGKTPKETLDMFVDALKKGDIELASKYFVLNDNSETPDYLTRNPWAKYLKDTADAGKIGDVISILSTAKPDLKGRYSESDYKFISIDPNGKMQGYVNMQLNEYAKVWKIESM